MILDDLRFVLRRDRMREQDCCRERGGSGGALECARRGQEGIEHHDVI